MCWNHLRLLLIQYVAYSSFSTYNMIYKFIIWQFCHVHVWGMPSALFPLQTCFDTSLAGSWCVSKYTPVSFKVTRHRSSGVWLQIKTIWGMCWCGIQKNTGHIPRPSRQGTFLENKHRCSFLRNLGSESVGRPFWMERLKAFCAVICY